MYILEKIDKLVLITLEGEIKVEEIKEIKSELTPLVDSGVEIVTSFDLSYMEDPEASSDTNENLNQLLRFCKDLGIKVHFYSKQ